MPQDFIPRKDADLLTFGTTFAAVIAAAPATYGLIAGDITPITTNVSQFGAALMDVDSLTAEATSAVAQKDALRTTVEAGIRALVRRIQADPAVTDMARANIGITVVDRVRSTTAPMVPTALTAGALGDGTNDLNWNRNGNLPATDFVLEVKRGAATEFSLLNVLSATSYVDLAATAGAKAVYRVRARRAGAESGNSNEAGVNLA